VKNLKFLIFTILLLFYFKQKAQTIFWTETFNNGCAANCLANGMNSGNGAWSVVSLAGDANPGIGDLPNQWYVSCAENGHTNTVCGSGCVAGNAANTLSSLHLSSTSVGDIGAAYDAGGLCGFLWCTNTHKRVQSPLISTVGYSGISIAYDYIEFGSGASDDLYAFEYSTNGGAGWTTLFNPAKTTCCGGACNGSLQGRWTNTTTVVLPVAANNIANFRMAFVWINNDDGIGADPSFAVDNIRVRYTAVLPVELISFNAEGNNNSVEVKWVTAPEKNSDYFEVQKTNDGTTFSTIAKVNAAANNSDLQHYSFYDTQPLNTVVYYRLKMVDGDNSFKYSETIAVEPNTPSFNYGYVYVNENKRIIVNKNFILKNYFEAISIVNTEGKILKTCNYYELENISEEQISLPEIDLQPGIYLVRFNGVSNQNNFKFIVPR